MSPAGDSAPSRSARLRRLLAAAATGAVVVAVDQLTKSWAVVRLASGPLHVAGPISLALTYNSGVAFSLGRGSTVLIVVGVVVVVVAIVLLMAIGRRVVSVPSAVALGAVLGGAIGNLADRLFRNHGGAVVDFVRVGFWPTFNLADAALVCGCVALGVISLRHGSKGHDRPSAGGGGSEGQATAR